MATRFCGLESGAVESALGVNVGADINQQTNNWLMATQCYGMESIAVELVLSMNVGTVVNEQTNNWLIATLCCGLESVAVVTALSVNVGTVVNEQTNWFMATVCRGLQVFLCQQQGVHSSCGSDPLLFTRLDAHVRNHLLFPNG
jgi:hypothetical protein